MDSLNVTNLLTGFPNNLGFVTNPRDPLYRLSNAAGILKEDVSFNLANKSNKLLIDTINPRDTYSIYFIQFPVDVNMNNIVIVPQPGSYAKVCNYESQFLDLNITGFDWVEDITPSGFSDDYNFIGITYSFDWDDPSYYISLSGSPFVYQYTDINFGDIEPEQFDYVTQTQNYATNGIDEYPVLTYETVTDTDVLPSGVNVGDRAKVSYLSNIPLSGVVTIIDANNLQFPNVSSSDGIIVNSNDYTVNGNKIIFAPLRSDFNPANITPSGMSYEEILSSGLLPSFLYPETAYQPDEGFNSSYIVEYQYRINLPKYMDMQVKLYDLPKTGLVFSY